MKKLISLMLAVLAIVSCEYRTETEREEAERLGGFNIVVIDSCEYIIKSRTAGYSGYGYFAHKGNCRFCKERKEKEMNELVKYLKKQITYDYINNLRTRHYSNTMDLVS